MSWGLNLELYMLAIKGAQPLHEMFNPLGGGRIVRVEGDDWVDARHRALVHAKNSDVDCAVVICQNTKLISRDRQTLHPRLGHSMYDQHALWLYVARLLRNRYRHVYVPPVALWRVAKPIPIYGAVNRPVAPLVAGYYVPTLANVRTRVDNLGQSLVSAGYDAYVVGDYAYEPVDNQYHFEEPGTATSWRKDYERATHRLFG